jgi:uncharacterized RDD family membrane protein YckC
LRSRGIMADERDRIGVSYDVKPHAYDPETQPELFDGVPARRVLAFLIDLVILSIPLILVWLFFVAIGIVTLGLGFGLLGLMPLITLIWAAFYYGTTLGGPRSATIGMRALDIEMRTWYGAPSYFVLAVVHAGLFWVSTSLLTPLILLVCFFNQRGRLLHDFLVGTVVINTNARPGAARPTGPDRTTV